MIVGIVYIFKKTQWLTFAAGDNVNLIALYQRYLAIYKSRIYCSVYINTTWINNNHYRFNMNFCATHTYFWTFYKIPWPSKGYASKLKISSYREIISVLDKKMSFYEILKESGHEKMSFRKFTYPFRARIVFEHNGRFFDFDFPYIGPRRENSD